MNKYTEEIAMIADIKSHIKGIMSEKRFEHTLGVAKSAKKLTNKMA